MPLPSHSDGGLDVDAVARGLAEMEQAIAERDRYRQVLERIGRVHGPWRPVVADALGCTVDDLDPRKNRA